MVESLVRERGEEVQSLAQFEIWVFSRRVMLTGERDTCLVLFIGWRERSVVVSEVLKIEFCFCVCFNLGWRVNSQLFPIIVVYEDVDDEPFC